MKKEQFDNANKLNGKISALENLKEQYEHFQKKDGLMICITDDERGNRHAHLEQPIPIYKCSDLRIKIDIILKEKIDGLDKEIKMAQKQFDEL